MLAIGAPGVPTAGAHPDLLAQIEQLGLQIQAEPGNPEWRIRRGDLYRRHEDYAAAALDFQAARALAPDHEELDFYQGRLALETGDQASAGAYLDRYLQRHPQHPVAWRLRAESLARQGDAPAAAVGYGNAIRFSDAPSPALYREWVLALIVSGDRPAALDAVDQGLDRLGAEVSLLGLGADVALVERQPTRAADYLAELPEGLRRRAPWRDRLAEAECLGAAGGNPPRAQAGCDLQAARRLDAQMAR